ncbi:hypothetical protein INT48_000114 [Thamnidium elegans]|uniref:Uncharacterized protein n=1 Tax=Thamnidium elegans TaxID=101142 RepID=A0A8H7SUL7_9FUNG|nr:hypothetical protein INT48_000114 [Thamnidium elegans]
MAVNPSATLESQDVGLIFVREYYTFLNKKPHRLHAFYNKDSLFVRGDEGTVTTTVQGQEEIRKKIEECHFEDCKVLVTQVDSQVSANNGILIQVLGEMCNQNGPSQKFSQTFFLAPQPNGYFVLNDIFRFLKDEVEIDYYTCEQEETPAPKQQEPKQQEAKQQETVVIDIAPSPVVPSSPVVEPTPVSAPAAVAEPVEVVKKEVKKPEVKKEVEAKKVEAVKEEVVEEKKKKPEPKIQQKKEQQKKENKPSAQKTWANLAATSSAVNGTVTPTEKTTTPSSPVVKATNIFVKSVVETISEEQLQEAFNKIGAVKTCSISRGKGCAFIEFHSPESCQKALAQHKVLVGNHTVHAEERRFNQNNNRFNNQGRTQNNQQQPYDRATGGGPGQTRMNQGGKGRGVPSNNTK